MWVRQLSLPERGGIQHEHTVKSLYCSEIHSLTSVKEGQDRRDIGWRHVCLDTQGGGSLVDVRVMSYSTWGRKAVLHCNLQYNTQDESSVQVPALHNEV